MKVVDSLWPLMQSVSVTKLSCEAFVNKTGQLCLFVLSQPSTNSLHGSCHASVSLLLSCRFTDHDPNHPARRQLADAMPWHPDPQFYIWKHSVRLDQRGPSPSNSQRMPLPSMVSRAALPSVFGIGLRSSHASVTCSVLRVLRGGSALSWARRPMSRWAMGLAVCSGHGGVGPL